MYNLLYANEAGEFFDHQWQAVGRAGDRYVEIINEDVIPLPPGAGLVLVPGGHPIGLNSRGEFKLLPEDPHQAGGVYAVAATLPQGYTRTLLPAYRRQTKEPLPLLGYAAVVARGEKLFVAAQRTDELKKWHPKYYSTTDLPKLVAKRRAQHPTNRILKHLAHCALEYQCFTAQNIFYQRWEGGIPASPICNAACLGCISKQPAECCPSPQNRIKFRPTVQELVEVGTEHLQIAAEAIISFGQGCEGEPSLAADTIAPAIKGMRAETPRGTININSNAGYTEGLKQIIDAGLDSIRVSTISATPEIYNAYYQPKNYNLENVTASIKYAKQNNVFVSLNLLTLPGLTDRESETESLINWIKQTGVDMIQIRNLNIDPDMLFAKLPVQDEDFYGIPQFISILQQQLPGVQIGNYSKAIK